MNKRILSFFICLLLGSVNIYAQTDVGDEKTVIAFFNGMINTKRDAKKSLEYLKKFYGETAPNGDKIRYELLYNKTFGLFEDLIEVFEQRTAELEYKSIQNRYELFFDIVNGDGPWHKWASDTMSGYKSMSDKMSADFLGLVITKTKESLSNSETEADYAEHRRKIDSWADEGKKLLFIAHSQGNLFVNVAYEHTKDRVGEQSVKVIHLAPVSVKTNGIHILADKDYVAAGLSWFSFLLGGVPEVTHDIPYYIFRPAGANGKKDILGHGFVEIYINSYLNISQVLKKYIDTALDSLS
ncbi:MAG: hypothetical protein LBP40_03835 [Campylobacteraceae bacterium]|nr:hypothetical protein [Campylobacteraceae bacterium]